jgi:hypothetical protein
MGSFSSKFLNAHSFYGVKSAKIIGECGVCGDGLISGRNQVYTMCEHLFCISCLLKWCKQCKEHDVPTCPLCRDPLYNNNEVEDEVEDEDEEGEVEDENEVEDEDEAEEEEEATRRQPTFTSDADRELHQNMPQLVAQRAIQYCQYDPESYAFGGYVMLIRMYNNANIIQDPNHIYALNGVPVGHQCKSYCVIKTTTQEYHIGKIVSMNYNLDEMNPSGYYYGFRTMNHDLTLTYIPQPIPFSSIEALYIYVPRILSQV